MKSYDTLCRNNDFQKLYRRGKSAVRGTMVLYAIKGRPTGLRMGITAGKKIGGAVCRNRAKRRIREVFRVNAPYLINGCDIVIVARAKIVNATADKVKSDFLSAATELGLFKKAERSCDDKKTFN